MVRYFPHAKVCLMLLLTSSMLPVGQVAAQRFVEQKKTNLGLQIVHPDAEEAKAFIRQNRCVLGGWRAREEAGFGWVGEVHYPVYNDVPDLTFMVGDIRVLRPTDRKTGERFAALGRVANVLLVRSKTKPGFFEVAGYGAPQPAMEDGLWLPITRGLDLARTFFRSKDYRYEGVLPTQLARLDSEDPKDQGQAARLLGAMGADARSAVGKLIGLVDDDDPGVASAAIGSLGAIGGPEAKKAIPRLIQAVSGKRTERAAIVALVKFGTDAREAAPAMIQVLAAADQNRASSTNYIIEALGQIAPDEARVREALEPYLKHEYATTRSAAAKALRVGDAKQKAVSSK